MAVCNNTLNSQTWLSCQMKCSALKKVCEKLEHLVTTNEYTCHIGGVAEHCPPCEQMHWLTALLSDAFTDCPISFSVPNQSEGALTELPETVLA